jgi:hypothetical protein
MHDHDDWQAEGPGFFTHRYNSYSVNKDLSNFNYGITRAYPSRLYKAYNSLPPVCVGGKPYPNCGPGGIPYKGRGVWVNPQTCKCEPACPSGKYYLGASGIYAQHYSKCGTKAQQDAVNKQAQIEIDCTSKKGCHWESSTADPGPGKCVCGDSGIGLDIPGIDIPLPWILAGVLGVAVVILLVTRK